MDLRRREFLRGKGRVTASPVRPPWTREAAIEAACTGCGDCIAVCPERVLVPDAARRPVLDFRRGECTFCGLCAEICRVPVFTHRDEPAFGHVAAVGATCLSARGIICQSCGDHCPEAAISFRPRLGAPPLPIISERQCTGCGACIAACPVGAIAPRTLEAAA